MPTSNGSGVASQYAKAARKMPSVIAPNTWTPAGLVKSGIKVYVDPSVKKENKKEKKMGWIRKKFNSWVRQAWEDARKEEMYATEASRPSESINGKSSVRFTIYPASGGYVIEHYKQDRYKDNEGPSLTIVPNGESLGTAVEHTITMEALKA
jgi:hypothetical protein